MSARDGAAPPLGDAVTRCRILVVDDDESLLAVEMESSIERGTKFTLNLPRREPPDDPGTPG